MIGRRRRRFYKSVKQKIIDATVNPFGTSNTRMAPAMIRLPELSPPYCLIIPGAEDYSGHDGSVRRASISFSIGTFQELLTDIRMEETIIGDMKGMMENSEFEDFTANVPDNWSLDSGVAGTNVLQETVDIFSEDSSLKMVETTGSINPKLSQVVDDMAASKKYNFEMYVKTSGVTTGNIKAKLVGTGVDVTLVDISSSYPAEYTGYSINFTSPAIIPANLELELFTDSIDSGATVLWDSAFLFGNFLVSGLLDLRDTILDTLDFQVLTKFPPIMSLPIISSSSTNIDVRPSSEGKLLGAIETTFRAELITGDC